MVRLFAQYMAIYNNENLPNSSQNLPNNVQNVAKVFYIKPSTYRQRILTISQSGDISSNMVTLVVSRLPFYTNKGALKDWSQDEQMLFFFLLVSCFSAI